MRALWAEQMTESCGLVTDVTGFMCDMYLFNQVRVCFLWKFGVAEWNFLYGGLQFLGQQPSQKHPVVQRRRDSFPLWLQTKNHRRPTHADERGEEHLLVVCGGGPKTPLPMRFAQLCLGLVALRSEGLLVGGPPRAEIARGSWVLLHGLSHSVELNGQEAIVEGMDADRYVVRLVDSHLYKKVRPEHLEPDRTRRSRPSPAVPSPCGEHEFDQPQELPQGPKELAPGAEVWVHGLTTAASMNDRKVLVRCFNPQTERYVVQLVDDDLGGVATGPLRAIKAEHLSLAESESDDGPSASVEAVADDSRGQVLRPGSHGKLVNLRNVAMNGKVVRILGYKEAGQCYSRMEAIASRLEAIDSRLEAIASRLEAIALRFLKVFVPSSVLYLPHVRLVASCS